MSCLHCKMANMYKNPVSTDCDDLPVSSVEKHISIFIMFTLIHVIFPMPCVCSQLEHILCYVYYYNCNASCMDINNVYLLYTELCNTFKVFK